MNNNYIEFKKRRELGDILTDTFAFLRQNFKSLFSVVFKIAGIPFLLLILSSAYYSYASFGMMDPLSGGNQLFQSGNILIALILMLIFLMVFYGLLYGSVLHYIKSYIERKGEIDQSEIIQGAKKGGRKQGLMQSAGEKAAWTALQQLPSRWVVSECV